MNHPDIDYGAAIATLRQADPALTGLIDTYAPYPFDLKPPVDTVLSALAKAIFYQSVSVQSATAVYGRFLDLYRDRHFPSAQAILETDDEVLHQVGLSQAKVRYLKAVAARAQIDLPSLETLATWDDETIVHRLTTLKGIGRWSVEMVLIFQLKRLDVLPVHDVGIRRAIRDLYHLDQRPDVAAVAQFGQRWRPYRTIASWYLWQSRNAATRALLKAWS